MSERGLKHLVGALALLVVVWIVGSILREGAGTIAPSAEIEGFFDDINGATVQGVHMEREGREVELARTTEGWTVNGFPADSAAVSRLLGVLTEVSIGDLIAANPQNHDRMGVSADSAWTVTFENGDGERTLLVGKAGRSFGTAYVRLPNTDQVYLLDGDLRSLISRDLEMWRNRTMVAVDSSSVARIEVERSDGGYVLVRGDSAWTFEGGGETVGTAVDGILAELSGMVATGFVAEGDSLAAADPAATLRALSGAGEILAEVSFGEGEGDRWARTSADEYLYRVSSFRANRVAPSREDVTPGG